MRATITRKLLVNTVCGYTVDIDEEGNAKVNALDPITMYGNVNKEQAKKELAKAYSCSDIHVGKITTDEKVYEISVEDFVAHAKVVEK